MKHELKRFLSIVLTIAMVICMVQGVVFAGNTMVAQIGDTKYAKLEDAIAAVTTSALTTITMIADIGSSDNYCEYATVHAITIANGRNIILDLAGKHIYAKTTVDGETCFIRVENGGSLIIRDSNGGGSINYLDGNDNTGGFVVCSAGDFTLEGGTLENTTECKNSSIQGAVDIHANEWGTPYTTNTAFTMTGGVLKSNNDNTLRIYDSSQTGSGKVNFIVDINGGEIYGKDAVFVMVQWTKNYDVSKNGIYMNPMTINVNKGKFDTTNGIRVVGNVGEKNTSDAAIIKINVNGGNFITTDTEKYRFEGVAFQESSGWNSDEASTEKLRSYCMINNKAAYDKYVAQIGETKYETLQAAIDAVESGESITMLKDVDGASALTIDTKKTFTIDFADHTYTISGPAVGSSGTQNQAFHLSKGQTITMKNGTVKLGAANLTATDGKISRVIQNYANLTLDNMKFDDENLAWRSESQTASGTLTSDSMIECDNGVVNLINGTTLTIKEENRSSRYALAMEDWPKGGYDDGVQVTVSGASINGHIRFYSDGQRTGAAFKTTLEFKTNTLNGKIYDNASGVSGKKITETISDCVLRAVATNVYVIGSEYVAEINDQTYTSLEAAIAAVTDGQTIKMLDNIVLTQELYIASDKAFILDLNGKTIENASTGFAFTTTKDGAGAIPARFMIIVEGTVRITDKSDSKNGKISASNYSYGTTKTVLVKENGNVTVEAGEVYGEYAAFYVVGYTGMSPETTSVIPVLTVNGGEVKGKSFGIVIKGKTATVTINDGASIIAEEDSAISTNGTTDWYNGGNSKITVHGGTIICNSGPALYFPAESVVLIDGGTITGTVALAVKGGNATVSEKASLIATGTQTSPAAVSSGVTNTGDTLYIEDTYANHKPIVNVTGGKLTSANGYSVQYFTDKTDTSNKGFVSLSGGYYKTSPAAAYIADGYVCVANTDEATKTEYPYVVKKITTEVAEVKASGSAIVIDTNSTEEPTKTVVVKDDKGEVVSGAAVATAAAVITETLNNPEVATFEDTKIEEATEVTEKTTIKNVDETSFNLSIILNEIKSTAAIQFAGTSGSAVVSGSGIIAVAVESGSVVETFTDSDVAKQITVDLTAATVETVSVSGIQAKVTSMIFEVQPIATITVKNSSGSSVTVKAVIPNEAITAPITFRLPVDKNVVASWAAVYHYDNQGAAEFIGNKEIKTGSEKKYIEVSSQIFSPFSYVLVDSEKAGAKIGEVPYHSLEEAYVDVKNNETITLLTDSAVHITVDKAITFKIDTNGKSYTGTVSAASGYKLETSTSGNVTTYKVTEKQSFTPGGSSAPVVKPVTESAIDAAKNCKRNENCVYAHFVDADTDVWYHDGLHYCTEKKYVQGIDDTHFNPSGTVSRAQMVALLYNIEGKPACTGSNTFSDVEEGRWYTDAVTWAAENGVITGRGDGTFAPYDEITREQMAALLYQYSQYKGLVKPEDTENVNTLSFDDIFTVSRWANAGMNWCIAKEIISGHDGKVMPLQTATRAELAVLMMNFCETIK